MPRPAYIAFAQSGAADQYTNRVSAFNFVETIEVVKNPDPEAGSSEQGKVEKYWIVCTWMKDAADRDSDVFETHITCTGPDGSDVFSGEPIPFSFQKNIWFFRLTVPDLGLPGYPLLGTYVIEGKIRKAGAEEWLATQEYPFFVREKIVPDKPLD